MVISEDYIPGYILCSLLYGRTAEARLFLAGVRTEA